MVGYWPSYFFGFFMHQDEVDQFRLGRVDGQFPRNLKTLKRTRLISIHSDLTSLVNKGCILLPKKRFFLRDQSEKSRAGKMGPSGLAGSSQLGFFTCSVYFSVQ